MRRALVITGLLLGSGLALADEPGVTMELERLTDASPDEMRGFAADAEAELSRIVKGLARFDAEATKKSGDGEGDECVSFNLEAARSLSTSVEGARDALQAALESGNQARAALEFRKIAIALDNGRLHEADGRRCALGVGVQAGNTRRDVDGGVGDPEDDTRPLEIDLTDVAFDPPRLAPFYFEPPRASPF